MFRNSIICRRLWYMKRRNVQSIHIFLRLVFIFILLMLFVVYTEKKVIPGLLQIYEAKANAVVSETVNNIAVNYLENGPDYKELVSINKDSSGRVVSLQDDIPRMNSISGRIAAQVSEQLASGNMKDITIPCGALLGNNIFSNMGPALRMHMAPQSNAEAVFKSEFLRIGTGQTAHKIYLEVRITVQITSFLVNERKEVITDIPVAENIIYITHFQ